MSDRLRLVYVLKDGCAFSKYLNEKLVWDRFKELKETAQYCAVFAAGQEGPIMEWPSRNGISPAFPRVVEVKKNYRGRQLMALSSTWRGIINEMATIPVHLSYDDIFAIARAKGGTMTRRSVLDCIRRYRDQGLIVGDAVRGFVVNMKKARELSIIA